MTLYFSYLKPESEALENTALKVLNTIHAVSETIDNRARQISEADTCRYSVKIFTEPENRCRLFSFHGRVSLENSVLRGSNRVSRAIEKRQIAL